MSERKIVIIWAMLFLSFVAGMAAAAWSSPTSALHSGSWAVRIVGCALPLFFAVGLSAGLALTLERFVENRTRKRSGLPPRRDWE